MARNPLSPRRLSLPRFAARRDEAAATVAVSPTKFDEWVAAGKMPKGRKIDGVVLWDLEELWECWVRLRDGETVRNNPFDRTVA